MRESVPRFALVLTGIVAIAALFFGIKDYEEQAKQTNQPTSATRTVVGSDTTTQQKKTTSAKTRQPRTSATDAPASSGSATDSLEKSLIRQESSKSEASAIVAMDSARNAGKDQGASRELEAAIDEGNRGGHEGSTIPNPASPTCLPLPNGTELGDVDAPYYDNWAGEYCVR